MSKKVDSEGTESEVTRVRHEPHPAEKTIVKSAYLGFQRDDYLADVMMPQTVGYGRSSNVILVKTHDGEWVRVTIKVTAIDVLAEG